MRDSQDSGPVDLDTMPGDDLSALAWVHGELRRSLENATKALRRYLKDNEAAAGGDIDAVDSSVLRAARTQLHQGVGALELVGLPAVATVLRAAESAVQRLVAKPALIDAKAVDVIERVSFGLLDYLARLLARKSVSPVMLFPQYRDALQLAGAERVHPADLWQADWQWRELPHDGAAQPRNADDEARGLMEADVLALMREPGPALTRMSDLCADLGAGARRLGQPQEGCLWQLAAAVFEAQASGLLQADVYTKRLASRLLAQLRASSKGATAPSDRLAQDLLFFCARAREPEPGRAPRLAAVRQAWRLTEQKLADYDSSRLGRFDPALLVQAKKRVNAAKDAWSAVAGGELHRLQPLADQMHLVGESLQKLFPAGDVLAASLEATAAQVLAAEAPPPPALAMEVATGILFLDASLEDGELDQPGLPERLAHLAGRIDAVRRGAEPQPLEIWMEELYRRVSDRQTMGSVVAELRASLSEVEKQIDQYFRNPADRQVLIPVPAQLGSMRGVLSVLGMDQASQAALHMRDAVDELAQTEVDGQRAIQAGTFDRLADNLGALSFLIDMLSVQPQLAKSLFRFDPETGSLTAVMGRTERASAFASLDEATVPMGMAPDTAAAPLVEQVQGLARAAADAGVADAQLARDAERLAQAATAADQRELAQLLSTAHRGLREGNDAATRARMRGELAEIAGLSAPIVAEPLPPSAPVPPPKPAPVGGTGLEDDIEMREIFVEEAREVVSDAQAAVERLMAAPDNLPDMTTVRRAFHTLKGSSRMIGLRDFGEAAWSCEQLYNARLASEARLDAPLRELTAEALAYLGDWVEAIAAGTPADHESAAVSRAADALRLEGRRMPILPLAALEAPALEEPALEVPEAETPVLEEVPVLDVAPPQPAPEPEPEPEPEADIDLGELTLPEFDLAAAPEDRTPLLSPLPPEPVDEEPRTVVWTPPAEPPADGPTIFMPVAGREPAAPTAAHGGLGSVSVRGDLDGEPATPALGEADFELHFDEPEAETPAPAAPSLMDRVPDLPAAAELDFAFGDAELEAEPVAEALVEPVLDESAADDLIDLPLDAPASEVETTTPLPVSQGVEALEIDLGELDDDHPFAERTLPIPVVDESAGDAAALAPGLPVPETLADTDLVLDFDAEPPPPAAESADIDAEVPVDDDPVKLIGDLRIPIPLFNIYLNEADELSRRLVNELAEWALEPQAQPVSDTAVALAHSLAGSSATVGYADLSALARSLEHALERSAAAGRGRPGEPELFNAAAEEIRRLLHQFAAGFLRPVDPALTEQLAAHERLPMPTEEPERADDEPLALAMPIAAPPDFVAPEPADDIDAVDAIDAELFPIFEEEADELLPQLQQRLREWHDHPGNPSAPAACMRTLHTFKGGARLAGAMRLGEMAHRLESAVEELMARDELVAADVDPLLMRADAMSSAYDLLRRGGATMPPPAAVPATPLMPALPELQPVALVDVEPVADLAAAPDALADSVVEPVAEPVAEAPSDAEPQADFALDFDLPEATEPTVESAAEAAPEEAAPAAAEATADELTTTDLELPLERPAPVVVADIDWQRFVGDASAAPVAADEARATAQGAAAAVRVRASLLDRLVNNAGEVSITRSRIDSTVAQLQGSLGELTESLERMRKQLRDIELQAETQIAARVEAAKSSSEGFDPLEMDRFTRFQELTRFMAESVNDVATLQRSLQRTLQSAEDELASQARLTRELQDDLLRTRMVEFESAADRLYRCVRQAARDTGKQARLDIVGGGIEIDRGVLERMVGSFEHLLRNSVAHGIESPAERSASGKSAGGVITVTVAQSGNEVAVDVADDGAGLDLARIRRRGLERGLIAPDASLSDDELGALIFAPGFSTADTVTELAGRGVGLDVVRSEVTAMGGRVQTHSEPGRGTRFRLLLPLTTAVTQIVMLRCGATAVAVPSPLIEVVRRVPTPEVEAAYESGTLTYQGESLPFFWLAALLQAGTRGGNSGRTQSIVVVRSAAQRVAVHVDEVVGNQEVVVKNVGRQLSRLPGLAGVTLLPSGAVALIYNPVALASVYAAPAHAAGQVAGPVAAAPNGAAAAATPPLAPAEPARAPMVMVVDDSLTVRRVTQRLLVREGYRVVTAKDGLDALERLAEERPAVLLSDIEMPRMDGFDLVRNVRNDARLEGLPVIMITSRIAQKHRDYAAELGVDHYLGKPYSEEELLGLISMHVARASATPLTH
jgi:chemosensory pili system protein ChpA (sensor histidine kinase/response regulator)